MSDALRAVVVIDSDLYGVATEFDSIEEAQEACRACGPDFADTTFREVGRVIRDERDNTVGRIEYRQNKTRGVSSLGTWMS